MSLNDRSSGPSDGTSPTPLQLAVEEQARGRGGDVAGGDGRQLAVARDRREEHALVLDRRDLADGVVHERGVGERAVGDSGGRDQVVHRERAGDVAGLAAQGVPRPSADTATTRPTPCLLNASAAGPGEADEGGLDRRGPRVRRCQPEDGVGARECLVHDGRVAVRALDDVEARAGRRPG